MTIETFKRLHVYEQEELIFNKGVFLATHVSGSSICDYYQLVSFYVGFYYMLGKKGAAIISAFKDPCLLPFLNDIDLSGLKP
jgi:hypothetical protein